MNMSKLDYYMAYVGVGIIVIGLAPSMFLIAIFINFLECEKTQDGKLEIYDQICYGDNEVCYIMFNNVIHFCGEKSSLPQNDIFKIPLIIATISTLALMFLAFYFAKRSEDVEIQEG